jgi:glycosyltransferase involved in cell wall biosynthesis
VTTVGLVAVDVDRKWIGGRYYLQHQVRAVAALPPSEQIGLADVAWVEAPDDDPFAEVRSLLGETRVIAPPRSLKGRVQRKVRNTLHGRHDAGDLFRAAGIDVLFPIAPCDNPGIPLVFWMPDFQPWRMPDLFSAELRAWYERHYRINGANAKLIVLSSEDGRRDLETFLPEFAAKARVLHFHSAPSPEWTSVEPAAAAAKYDLPDRFFLLSNQFSHHKNHMVVLEAVRQLRDRGLDVTLACTGSTYGFRGSDYFEAVTKFIDEHRLAKSVRILGLIDRSDQVALMRRSIAMLQPSRFEGWSTVVEDARTLGKGLLASDIAVHREQAVPGCTYLPVDEPDAWAAAMAEVADTCPPGPDAELERTSLAGLQTAMAEAGRRFSALMNEAVRA